MSGKYDVLVVGGGPGGYTAALYCARAGRSVAVLERLMPGGQMSTTVQVENYPGFQDGIGGAELATQMKKGAEKFGAETLMTEVLSAELRDEIKLIRTKSGELEAQAVVLATGMSPRELGLPGERELRGRGISYCATCDGMFFRGKAVAVVGGGNTAVADALYLARICEKVYLVHRRDTLRADRTGADRISAENKIEPVWNSTVEKLHFDKTLTGITVKSTGGTQREIECAGLFVAIGSIPNNDLFAGQVELDPAGFAAADETTRTSVPGVFAVGDVRGKPVRQIVTAAADGAVASRFIEDYLESKK